MACCAARFDSKRQRGEMLTVETIGRIRREHFLKGKTIKEIARDLKVSRNTVRKVLRSGMTSFEYERNIQPRPKLGRWRSEEHTSELQSQSNLVCRLLLEKKKKKKSQHTRDLGPSHEIGTERARPD